jgi:four helix bundle protein
MRLRGELGAGPGSWFMVPRFRVRSGFWVLGSGFWVLGSGFWVLGSGFGARFASTVRMIAQRYQDLDCWQLSNELKRRVYAFIAEPPASKDFEFCDQIRRSARGAPRTIAEGFGRFRPKEFARYLEFARASLMETQNHLGDALDCKYVTAEKHDALFALADRAIGASTRLYQYLKTCKTGPGTKNPGTQNRGTQNPRTQNPRTKNPRTKNPEPGTKNEP